MTGEILTFFRSFFHLTPWGVGLAVAFGVVWLAGFLPPFHRKPWLGAVLVASAILTLAAITFIQIPLQLFIGDTLSRFFSWPTVLDWMLLASIPGISVSGLVQEGAKMVPQMFFWWRQGRKLNPKLGLCLGAVAGAGFGIFEANWIHSLVLSSGWSWSVVNDNGLIGLAPFIERFFVVAFHIGTSALVGYGLARGWGWQFYLIASLLHAILNYATIMLQAGVISGLWVEIFTVVWAVAVIGSALWLRWRREQPAAEPVAEPVMPETSPGQPSP
ncbi:MAG: YhfC family glutamic-type intramembrane protease [Chloroflexota bacterium]